MRAEKLMCVLVVTLYALPAHAVPFHGCSFYSPRLISESMECANLTIRPGGCMIVHCIPIGCVMYEGAQFTGWLPEYFLEVTNRAGSSAFTSDVDGAVLAVQLEAAKLNWQSHGDTIGLSTTSELSTNQSESSMYFGRSLAVPYGPVGWSFSTLGLSAGTPAPTCFSGITEFAAETWADSLSSGDREIAAAWAPVTAPACGLGAPIMGTIASIPRPTSSPSEAAVCAFPLVAAAQKTLALSGKSARDPTKQCMGALGGLLPRTGWTDGDSYTAAQRVGWRTASLSEDYFRTGVGVQGDDKWQIVWPVTPVPRCFSPGSLTRPSTNDPTSTLVRGPGYDAPAGNGVAEFVFAVWRKHSKCVEPAAYPAVQAELLAHPVVHTAACTVLNAAVGGL